MKREIVFKMERPGLVEEGQVVEVSESVTCYGQYSPARVD